ncbi:MAG: carboxypeptidase regulatory-like domain-containing protein, partial [Bryobacteraceae bacterium]|nr:carboxypeptidase regulatory-like domain-containing protein [Bryobacteraceae bacterium]
DGNLLGTVLDASGGAVAGASVEVVNQSTNAKQAAVSDSLGQYRFGNLPVGSYTLKAWAEGFQTSSIRNVAVQLNRSATANITLEVSAAVSSVTVTEAPSLLDTTTAQIGSTYGARQAQQLPLTGVSSLGVLNLSLYSAGVASNGGIGFGTGPSVGGQRPSNNNFMVDGIDNNDRATTGPVIAVTNEAVAEFSLLQNQFSSEFGHSTGGQFNTIVKTGTNQVHGTLYEYFQNRNLNAIDESFKRTGVRSRPRYDQNRVGGNLGGPIRKDKLFYFLNYEYNPTGRAAGNAGTVNVPTAEGYRILEGIGGLSRPNLETFQKHVPAAAVASGRSVAVNGVQVPLGTLRAIGASYETVQNWVASGDYNVSARDQIRARYMKRSFKSIDANAGLPEFFTPSVLSSHLASLSHFHTFSPAFTNELRLAYTRYTSDYPVDQYSFPGLDAFPTLQFNDLGLSVGPFWVFPQTDRSNSYQVMNNATYLQGRHTLKFGYDGRKLNRSNFFVQRARGDYRYNTLERYLLDLTPEFALRSTGGLPFAGNLLSHYAYINDDFRVRPNLTLNLGLRYEFVGVPAGAKLQRLNSVASIPGFDFREPKPGYRDFAPRLGLAWSPGHSGKTAVRAGFGMAYDQFYQNMGVLSLPPQFSTTVDAHTSRAGQPNFLGGGGIANVFQPITDPATARANTAAYIPDQVRPYSLQWTLGVQHTFHSDYTFEVRYLGTRGVHLPMQMQLNRQALVTSPETAALPTFLQAPSQQTIDGLTTSLADVMRFNVNTLASQGFFAPMTSFTPQGNSSYHGMGIQLNRRFSKGLQVATGYTWSHNIDDSATVVASTLINPRRPQDFQNLRNERGDSALDRRHRLSVSCLYETPRLGTRNWLARNVAGNWVLSGAYIAETGGWATALSGVDSNVNGDNAADRVIVNPGGSANVGSGVRALCTGSGPCNPNVPADRARVVGWVAENPNARYITAGNGAYATAGRNTLRLPGINNFDLAVAKRFSLDEVKVIEFRAEAYNAFNHAQYTPGYINAVNWRARVNGSDITMLIPGGVGASNAASVANPAFLRPDLAFQSNSRTMQLVLRFGF